jgi:SAM-dependent methyltransferase
MLAVAARRADDLGLTNVSTRRLDLEQIAEPTASYDVVLCREGLMFAGDPVRAAADIRRVLRPGGRVAVSVWGAREANPWLGVLGRSVGAELAQPAPPPGPNPFSLSDPERLRTVLVQGGFQEVSVQAVAVPRRLATFDVWWEWVMALAPMARAVAALPAETVSRIRVRAGEEMARYETADGLEIPGLALIASGRSPLA